MYGFEGYRFLTLFGPMNTVVYIASGLILLRDNQVITVMTKKQTDSFSALYLQKGSLSYNYTSIQFLMICLDLSSL